MYFFNRLPPYYDVVHKSKIKDRLFISIMRRDKVWISYVNMIQSCIILYDMHLFSHFKEIKYKKYDSSDKKWNL